MTEREWCDQCHCWVDDGKHNAFCPNSPAHSSPAPAVGELVETLNSYATDHGGYFGTRNVSVPKQLITNAAARISQLEAGLKEATDDMAHEYGDDEATVVRLRALLKGQS
jgi:hypothetical protein